MNELSHIWAYSKIYCNKSMPDTRELKNENCAREIVSSGPAWIDKRHRQNRSLVCDMSWASVCATSGDTQTTRNTNTPMAGCWIWSVLLWWTWPLNSRGLLLKVSNCAEGSHGTVYQPDGSESHKAHLLRAWQRVVIDNGPQYDSEMCGKFAKEWCFNHVTSSPHYPKPNGFIERTVKTVKMTLKKAESSKLDPYLALLCIRTTPVDNVLPSPAEMM